MSSLPLLPSAHGPRTLECRSPSALEVDRDAASPRSAPSTPSSASEGNELVDRLERGGLRELPAELPPSWRIPRPRALRQAAIDVTGGAVAGAGALLAARSLGKPAEDLPLSLHKTVDAALMGAAMGAAAPLLRLCNPGSFSEPSLRLVAVPWQPVRYAAFVQDTWRRPTALLSNTAAATALLGLFYGLTVHLPNQLACHTAFCGHATDADEGLRPQPAALWETSLVAPVLEEILFRGILLPRMHQAGRALQRRCSLEPRDSLVWQAARMGSSLTFGCLHVTNPGPHRWVQATGASALGMIYADVSAHRGLLAAIALHVAWNTLVGVCSGVWRLLDMQDPYA